MASSPGPVVQRELLIRELRDKRRALGRGEDQTASELNWPGDRLIAVEGGLEPISSDDLRRLLEYYGGEEDEIQRLTELAEATAEPGYWEPYRQHIDGSFLTYLQYENGAARVEQFQDHLVHGLLQTAEYAEAVLRQWYATDAERLRALVELRIARQEQLRDTPQTFILDESVLRRRIGGRFVMSGQLSALLTTLRERPHVTVQILPLSEGATFGIRGPFGLATFDNGLEPVVYLERDPRNLVLVGDGPEVRAHMAAFSVLRRRALEPGRSVQLIEDALSGLSGADA
jgi:hypothetical protein